MPTIAFRATKVGWLLFAAWTLIYFPLVASAAEKLPTVEFAFQASAPDGVRVTSTGQTAFFTSVHRTGGVISGEVEPTWKVDPDAPIGEGALDVLLDRTRLTGDLALVVRADWQSKSDVAIQLFDADGQPVALDLFGNLALNARAASTDTFVVPLTRYPSATRLSIRRLNGPLAVHAAGLFPVLSEMPTSVQAQKAIAEQLGLVFRPAAIAADARKSTGTENENAATTTILGTIHTVPRLEVTNRIGATALAEVGYPVFRRITEGTLTSEMISSSGTTHDFVKAALRTLALESQSALAQPSFTSSDGVAADLLDEKATLGVMSVPLTSAEKERFFDKHGYPIMEFKVAHDAIEILVNADNPLKQITVPQLDAIYSVSPRAGASAPMRDWAELGVNAGAIHAFGGSPGWGTAKSFQQMVLKGGDFRPGITTADVVFRQGIEEKIAKDVAAIGYMSLRPRQRDVRVLAVSANSGEKAWPVEADAIYSGQYPLQRTFYGYLARKTLESATSLEREMVNLLLSDTGQLIVANSGSLPLNAHETKSTRADLGLPR